MSTASTHSACPMMMTSGKQEHQPTLQDQEKVDPLAVPLEHPRWEIELSRRDKVNMYYHVIGSIAPSQCLRKHLSENVTMIVPLTDARISGRCAVLKAIDSWLECFSPYQISPVVLADAAPSFALTSMWRSTGLNTKTVAGIAPTGKVIKLNGGTQFLFDKDDNILHIHVHFDGNDLLSQLKGGR